MLQQLYRTDVVHPKALVLNFTSDLIAEMFEPIVSFLNFHRIRIKAIVSNGLVLSVTYYKGDRPISINFNHDNKGSTYYILAENSELRVIHEDELSNTEFSLVKPFEDF